MAGLHLRCMNRWFMAGSNPQVRSRKSPEVNCTLSVTILGIQCLTQPTLKANLL